MIYHTIFQKWVSLFSLYYFKLAVVLVLGVILPSGPVWSQELKEMTNPRHCYGDDDPKWLFGETWYGLTNSFGMENQVRFEYCWPLIRKPGLLYDFSNIEIGAFNYQSPSYSQSGVFLAITPLSFINFRLEVAGMYTWTLPGFTGTGYNPRASYRDAFLSDGFNNDLPVDKAHSASGLNILFNTTFQGAIPLRKTARGYFELILLNTTGFEYWQVGDEPFYYNRRRDITLARTDTILINTALVLFGIPVRSNWTLRIGATDNLIFIPSINKLGLHQVGGMIGLNFDKLSNSVSALMIFLQVSAFTHHIARDLLFSWNFVLGLDLAVVIHRDKKPKR